MSCPTGAVPAPGISGASEIMMTVQTWKEMTGQQSTFFDTYLGFLEPKVVQVSDLCSANPSDPGNPSLTMLANLITSPVTGIADFLNYVLQKMEYYEFTKVCVCSSSTCLGFPYDTAGWTAFDTGSGNEEVGIRFQMDQTSDCPGVWLYNPFGSTATYNCHLWNSSGVLLATKTAFAVSAGAHTYATWDAGTVSLTSGQQYTVSLTKGGAGNSYPGKTPAAGITLFQPYAHYIGAYAALSPPAYPNIVNGALVAVFPELCNGTPTAIVQPSPPTGLIQPTPPTCSTTGDICAILNQILLNVQANYNLTTILQRRERPFAWIAGTSSTGLTGHGTITVQDIIGCIVSLTTVPAGWGFTADTPRRYVPTLGAIQASDGTRFDNWREVHYREGIFEIPSWATSLSYSFRNGVVATVTPFKPEP